MSTPAEASAITRRRHLGGLLVLLVTGLVTAGPAHAGSAPVPGSAPRAVPAAQLRADPEKYYVVRTEYEGQPEYLYEIAERFLRDGERYREIFDLNKGRPQPDGLRMTEPEQVEPGWILLLPQDADGAEVEAGPLPVVTAVPIESSATAVPAAAAPSSDGPGTGVVVGSVLGGLGLSGAIGALLVRRRRHRTGIPDAPAVAPAAQVPVLTRQVQQARPARQHVPAPAPVVEPARTPAAPATVADASQAAVSAWSQARIQPPPTTPPTIG